MWNFPLFPDRASTVAGRVDAVFFFNLGVTAFFTALICALIVTFAIKYRRGSRADRSNAVTHSLKIELVWIVIPLCIVVVQFVWAANVYFQIYDPPGDATSIDVIAKQWMWKLQHPEGKREINELHIPLGRPVKLRMISQDVIHSFYVPAFRVKQDVLPGRYTSLWFQPTRTGRFHLFCAEYCGTNHSGMGGEVVVMEPSDYETWLSQGRADASMPLAGARLFEEHHCSGCHNANSSVHAPRLEGVYGESVPIQEGDIVRWVTADDRYIRDSILLPQSQVVAGYKPIMPSFQGQISEDDLLQIIAYIKAIGRKKGEGR